MDGAVDASATKVASNAGMDLYLGWNGSDLYMATQTANGTANDAFLFVAGSRGALVASPWGKAGQAGQWSAFLANESTNNYTGWTNQVGTVHQYSGTYLEGTINLAGQFGGVPSVVYVAAGRWATANGGALAAQCPAGNGDANLDGTEYYAYSLGTAGVEPVTIAGGLRLLPVAPNPMRGEAALGYVLPREATVALEVYDVRGRRVAAPASGMQAAGVHVARWDAANAPAGVYFVRLRAGGEHRTQRVMVIR
jgi:hypothetical protein